MKLIKKPLLWLLGILLLATVLRIYNLGNVPQSLNWDEVSLGYNAYSVLKTGSDEYKSFLPLVLRSFDDYKPALYMYFAIPFVSFLGLTEQAVRLPSAVAGIAAVGLSYFLVIEILGRRNIEILQRKIDARYVALLTAFFLAISPWHIQFSRISFESNVGLTLNILAFLLFLMGLKRNYLLVFSFVIASLNIHMYQSDRVFSPLLIIVLSIIFFRKLITIKKWVALSVIAAFIVAFPLLFYIATNSNALQRAKGVSVFSSQSVVQRSAVKLLEDEKRSYTLGKVLDNRRIEFVKATVAGYISHFDVNWLFITGDIARHHAPHMGLLYIFQLPLLLVGIYFFTFLSIDTSRKVAFFAYFLLVPIPASITSGVPHAVRTLNFEWTWELFMAIGMIALVAIILKQRNKLKRMLFYVCACCYGLFALFNIVYYLNQYFVQQNFFTASDWLYGYKQAVAYVKPIQNQYDKIIVENEVPFDQSYMFFLFYLGVDPAYYQAVGGTATGGFREEHRGFYNYTFKPVRHSNEEGKVLFVGKLNDMQNYRIKKVIYLPDGSPAVAIAEK